MVVWEGLKGEGKGGSVARREASSKKEPPGIAAAEEGEQSEELLYTGPIREDEMPGTPCQDSFPDIPTQPTKLTLPINLVRNGRQFEIWGKTSCYLLVFINPVSLHLAPHSLGKLS